MDPAVSRTLEKGAEMLKEELGVFGGRVVPMKTAITTETPSFLFFPTGTIFNELTSSSASGSNEKKVEEVGGEIIEEKAKEEIEQMIAMKTREGETAFARARQIKTEAAWEEAKGVALAISNYWKGVIEDIQLGRSPLVVHQEEIAFQRDYWWEKVGVAEVKVLASKPCDNDSSMKIERTNMLVTMIREKVWPTVSEAMKVFIEHPSEEKIRNVSISSFAFASSAASLSAAAATSAPSHSNAAAAAFAYVADYVPAYAIATTYGHAYGYAPAAATCYDSAAAYSSESAPASIYTFASMISKMFSASLSEIVETGKIFEAAEVSNSITFNVLKEHSSSFKDIEKENLIWSVQLARETAACVNAIIAFKKEQEMTSHPNKKIKKEIEGQKLCYNKEQQILKEIKALAESPYGNKGKLWEELERPFLVMKMAYEEFKSPILPAMREFMAHPSEKTLKAINQSFIITMTADEAEEELEKAEIFAKIANDAAELARCEYNKDDQDYCNWSATMTREILDFIKARVSFSSSKAIFNTSDSSNITGLNEEGVAEETIHGDKSQKGEIKEEEAEDLLEETAVKSPKEEAKQIIIAKSKEGEAAFARARQTESEASWEVAKGVALSISNYYKEIIESMPSEVNLEDAAFQKEYWLEKSRIAEIEVLAIRADLHPANSRKHEKQIDTLIMMLREKAWPAISQAMKAFIEYPDEAKMLNVCKFTSTYASSCSSVCSSASTYDFSSARDSASLSRYSEEYAHASACAAASIYTYLCAAASASAPVFASMYAYASDYAYDNAFISSTAFTAASISILVSSSVTASEALAVGNIANDMADRAKLSVDLARKNNSDPKNQNDNLEWVINVTRETADYARAVAKYRGEQEVLLGKVMTPSPEWEHRAELTWAQVKEENSENAWKAAEIAAKEVEAKCQQAIMECQQNQVIIPKEMLWKKDYWTEKANFAEIKALAASCPSTDDWDVEWNHMNARWNHINNIIKMTREKLGSPISLAMKQFIKAPSKATLQATDKSFVIAMTASEAEEMARSAKIFAKVATDWAQLTKDYAIFDPIMQRDFSWLMQITKGILEFARAVAVFKTTEQA